MGPEDIGPLDMLRVIGKIARGGAAPQPTAGQRAIAGGRDIYVPDVSVASAPASIAQQSYGATAPMSPAPSVEPPLSISAAPPPEGITAYTPGYTSSTTSGIKMPSDVTRLQEEAYNKTIEAAKLSADAARAENEAQLQAYGEVGTERKRAIDEIASKQRLIDADRVKLMARYQSDIEAVKSEQTNPDRWMSGRNGLQQILLAAAQIMGSHAAAMGGGPNLVQKYIDGAIERDIRAQELAMQSKRQGVAEERGLLDLMHQRSRDLEADKANLRVLYSQELAERAQQARLASGDARIAGQYAGVEAAAMQNLAAAKTKQAELASSRTVTQRSQPGQYTIDGKQVSEPQIGLEMQLADRQVKLLAASLAAQNAQAKLGQANINKTQQAKRLEQADSGEAFAIKGLEFARIAARTGYGEKLMRWVRDDIAKGRVLQGSEVGVANKSFIGAMAVQEIKSLGAPMSEGVMREKIGQYVGIGLGGYTDDGHGGSGEAPIKTGNNALIGAALTTKYDQVIANLRGAAETAKLQGSDQEVRALEGKIARIEDLKAKMQTTLGISE